MHRHVCGHYVEGRDRVARNDFARSSVALNSTPSGGSITVTDEAKGKIRVTIPASMSSGLTNADETRLRGHGDHRSWRGYTAVDSTIKVLMGV